MNLANEHQVVIVHGPPGCGKTTQVIVVILPQTMNVFLCMEMTCRYHSSCWKIILIVGVALTATLLLHTHTVWLPWRRQNVSVQSVMKSWVTQLVMKWVRC